MPRSYSMSWIESRQRWMKMYKGSRYVISCKALGVPATKEESYQAANQWWVQKQKEIDGNAQPTDRKREALEILVENAPHRKPKNKAEDAIQRFRELVATAQIGHGQVLPNGFHEFWLGNERVGQIDATVKAIGEGKAPPTELTVKGQYDAWVNRQRAAARAGNISPDRADNNRISLAHFLKFLGEYSPITCVNDTQMEGYYLHLLGEVAKRKRGGKDGWSPDYAKHLFGVAKQWIRHLWEASVIELPRKMNSKAFVFKSGAKKVKTWTVEEVVAAIRRAPGQLKLHLLLMVNCGMLMTDISDLLQTDVDWRAGRIIRKRSKTEEHEDVPTVSYKLWPVTLGLLKKYRSSHAVYAAHPRPKGKQWVRKEITPDGKLKKE